MTVNKDMGSTGAGNNIGSNGGSSSPKTPSGTGSSNKKMGPTGAGSNMNQKGGGSIGVK